MGTSVRYPELDICRSVAILMMISYHFFVDLIFLDLPGPDPFSGLLRIFGYCTAILFVSIAGISAHIKVERTLGFRDQILGFTKRGGELILLGCGITVVTWWVLHGEGYVVFGILHLIGTSLILAPFFHRLGYYVLVPATGIILIGLSGIIPPGPFWMVWLGMVPPGFYSVDYTPLFPWLAVFLIGMFIGMLLYPKAVPRFLLSNSNFSQFHPLVWAGRHSLLIYLIHQPVLITLLSVATGKML